MKKHFGRSAFFVNKMDLILANSTDVESVSTAPESNSNPTITIPQNRLGVKSQSSLKHSVIFGDSPAAVEDVAPAVDNTASEMPENAKAPAFQNGYLNLELDVGKYN